MTLEKLPEGTIKLLCTEREARQIASALGIHADLMYGASKATHEINSQFRRLQFHANESEKWAKEIFERVGY